MIQKPFENEKIRLHSKEPIVAINDSKIKEGKL